MKQKNLTHLQNFLREHLGMAIVPSEDEGTKLVGLFEFTARAENLPVINDWYELEIRVPHNFPTDFPLIYEIGGKIPRDVDNHVYGDGWLCLGSYFRLKIQLWKDQSLTGYVDSLLIPFLYAFSHQIKNGGKLVFGELEHYDVGLQKDYAEILDVSTLSQTRQALFLLCISHSKAINMNCPCGCGRKLGKCEYRYKLLRLRGVASQEWYQNQLGSSAFKEPNSPTLTFWDDYRQLLSV